MATETEITRQFAGVLAATLTKKWGETWTVDTESDHWHASLKGPNGKGMWLRIERDKVTLHGSYPLPDADRSDYGIERPSIGFSRTKPIERIVDDIGRRFWPRYVEALEQIERRQTLATLARMSKVSRRDNLLTLKRVQEWGTDGTLAWRGPDEQSIDFNLGHDGSSVRISRGSVSFRTMERILMLLENDA